MPSDSMVEECWEKDSKRCAWPEAAKSQVLHFTGPYMFYLSCPSFRVPRVSCRPEKRRRPRRQWEVHSVAHIATTLVEGHHRLNARRSMLPGLACEEYNSNIYIYMVSSDSGTVGDNEIELPTTVTTLVTLGSEKIRSAL